MSRLNEKEVVVHISTGTIFRVLIILVALVFLWFVRDILIMLFVALLLAALIEPFADWLHRYKIPRGFGVLVIYIILFAAVAVSLLLIVPPFVDQFGKLFESLSTIFFGVGDSISRLYEFSAQFGFKEQLVQSVNELQGSFGNVIAGLFSTITGIVGGLIQLIIILVLAFYMVVEEDAWRRLFRRVAPDEYQPYLTQLFTKMQKKIGMWLRGQLLLMLIVGVTTYIGLTLLGVEYALVLALFAGVMEVVPYAGPTIGAVPAIVIAFVQSPVLGVAVLLLYVVIQQIENNILVPKIMQKVTGLNPIVSIVALLVGFKLGSVAGAVLAIPVATLVSVFLYDIMSHEQGSS
jgi:predicted PurR-regulated permease PerM